MSKLCDVGNSLWRLVFLLKSISLDDSTEIMNGLMDLMKKWFVKIVRFDELDPSRIIKLAIAKGLTFYDSAYITAAEKLEPPSFSISLLSFLSSSLSLIARFFARLIDIRCGFKIKNIYSCISILMYEDDNYKRGFV